MSNVISAAATGLPSRRGFLRGLTSLPLIGGGLTLIGQPTAAAVPVTDALHERYLAWLAHEHRAAVREHAYRTAFAHALRTQRPDSRISAAGYAADARASADYLCWFPDVPDVALAVDAAAPSSRAAVILSAAGVALSGARA